MAEDPAPMALNSFTVLPHKLMRAVVVDQGGQAIGIVEHVEMAAGRPSRVDVLMPGGRRLAIGTAQASYDPIANQVVTDATAVRTAEARQAPRS